MCFKLGAVLVKGGKIISTGYNHHRTHYDGAEVSRHGHRKPVSMHAEMHAIFSLTGMSPSFKKQVQGAEWRVPSRQLQPCRTHPNKTSPCACPGAAAATASRGSSLERRSPSSKGCTAHEWCLSGEGSAHTSESVESFEECSAAHERCARVNDVEHRGEQWRGIEWM